MYIQRTATLLKTLFFSPQLSIFEQCNLQSGLLCILYVSSQYLGIVYINAMFKVNRFNVPLLSIMRTTSLNTTFYIANIFLVGKTTSDYTQAIKILQKLAKTYSIMLDVIFINKEDALTNAIALVFLKTRQFYCIFHINRCILHKVQKVYLEGKNQDSFFNDQHQVVQAKTEERFNEKWKLLIKDSI